MDFATNPGGRYLAVSYSHRSEARVYDVVAGRQAGESMRHGNLVWALAFSPDGQTLLTVSGDRTARLWSVANGDPLTPSLPHGDLRNCTFSPDGHYFATAERDGLIRVWMLPIAPNNHRIPVEVAESHVVMSADGRYVIPAGWWFRRSQFATRVYEVTTGMQVGRNLEVGGLINGATFSPNGRHVVTLSSLPEDDQLGCVTF